MEIFKKIDDYDYEISNIGRVRSLKRAIILKPQHKHNRMKYGSVYLWKDGEETRFNIADLMYKYFPETNPKTYEKKFTKQELDFLIKSVEHYRKNSKDELEYACCGLLISKLKHI